MDPAPDPRTRLKCCALRPDKYRGLEMAEIHDLRAWVTQRPRDPAIDHLRFDCKVCGQVWEEHWVGYMHASTTVVVKAGESPDLGPSASEEPVQFEPWPPPPQPPPPRPPPKSFGQKLAPWALVGGLAAGLWALPRLGGGVGLRILEWLVVAATVIVGVPLLLLGLKSARKPPP